MTKIMPWSEVVKLHGTVSAVSFSNSRIKSLLSGNSNHIDEINGEFLKYSVPTRKHYNKVMSGFLNLLHEKSSIKVFHKLRSNEWLNLGDFVVSGIETVDNFNLIILKRVIP